MKLALAEIVAGVPAAIAWKPPPHPIVPWLTIGAGLLIVARTSALTSFRDYGPQPAIG